MDLKMREQNNIRHQMNVLYFSGFLDLFAVSMVIQLILPQALELGASPTLAGVLGSVYGALQLFTSPIMGKWSDGVSRRFSLFVCMLGSCLGYGVPCLYNSIVLLFLSRFILGIWKHSQTISRAVLSDLSDLQPSLRPATLLGHFNSFSSIGFIVGPIVGGHLAESQWGFPLVCLVAGLVFSVNGALVWWLIPPDSKSKPELSQHSQADTLPSTQNYVTKSGSTEKTSDSQSDGPPLSKSFKATGWEGEQKMKPQEFAPTEKRLGLNHIWEIAVGSVKDVNLPQIWDLLLMRFFAGFSMLVFRTNFTLVLKHRFDATPSMIGYITSFNGVVSALSGFVIGPLMKRYKNDNAKLLFHSTIFQVVSLAALCLAPSLSLILVALVPLNLMTSVARVTATTLTVASATGTKAPSSSYEKIIEISPTKTANEEKEELSEKEIDKRTYGSSNGYVVESKSGESLEENTLILRKRNKKHSSEDDIEDIQNIGDSTDKQIDASVGEISSESLKAKISSTSSPLLGNLASSPPPSVKSSSIASTPSPKSPVAAVLGLGQSVMSTSRLCAPIAAGLSSQLCGLETPGWMAAVAAAVAGGILMFSGRLGSQDKKKE